MTHQEYRERLDEILEDLKNYYQNECDYIWLAGNGKFTVAEAKQAIDRLFLDVVGDDLPTDMHGSWTRRKDGSMLLLSDEVVITNKVKQQLRTTITGEEGGDDTER